MWAALRKPKKVVPLLILALFFFTLTIGSPPNAAKVVFYPAYREAKKISFVMGNSGYNLMESGNFRLYFKEPSKVFVEIVINDAENKLKSVIEDFNYKLNGKINVILYSEYEEMAERVGLSSGSPAMGVYYGGTISILSPENWISKDMDIRYVFETQGPMVHEITHYVLDYMSGGNIPVWFTEGAALYEEYTVNGVEWAAGMIFDSYYSVNTMESRFYKLNEVKAYRQSFLTFKYIVDHFGMEAVLDIVNELRWGRSMEQAAQKVIGMGVEELFKKSLS